jgi:hypothetical protein
VPITGGSLRVPHQAPLLALDGAVSFAGAIIPMGPTGVRPSALILASTVAPRRPGLVVTPCSGRSAPGRPSPVRLV